MAGKTPSEVCIYLYLCTTLSNKNILTINLLFCIQKRLHKELLSLVKEPPPGMVVDIEQAEQNLTTLVKIMIFFFECLDFYLKIK